MSEQNPQEQLPKTDQQVAEQIERIGGKLVDRALGDPTYTDAPGVYTFKHRGFHGPDYKGVGFSDRDEEASLQVTKENSGVHANLIVEKRPFARDLKVGDGPYDRRNAEQSASAAATTLAKVRSETSRAKLKNEEQKAA